MRSPRTLFSRGLVWPFACLAVRLFWVGLAAVIATSATAQPAGTGTIRGRVQNATNGAFMENVVVNIAGTSRQVRTNAYGNFVLEGVPAGEVTLRASYVGEPDQTTSVTVPAGGEAAQNFTFRRSTTHKTTDDGAVILDPFVINAERYRNARAIATAEERLSINIKNVVSVDQFGYIPSGNVGEFVKFVPGVQIDYGSSNGNNQGYSENAANGVSVRGFGPEDTAILIDGLPVSSTLPGNLTRQVGLDQLSINNASRVELIKVATPDMPANSIGGQVNLVTRNAFEYPKPTYSGRLFFNFNSLKPDLKKTPGPTNKDTFKTTPGVDFTVTYPLSDTLGVSFTAYWAQEFNQNYRGRPYWNNDYASNYRNGAVTNSAGEASSMANPVLTRVQVTDQGDFVERRSGNFKVDWRPTPNQLLRANVQYSTYTADEAQRRLDFRPNIANGIEWGPDRVVGGAANSTTAMTVTTRDRDGDTLSAQLQYELDVAGFRFTAAGSISESKSDFRDEENGHFSEIALNLNPGRVALYDLRDGLPGRVETFTRGANSAPVDYRQLSNWVFDGTTAKSGQSHNERTISLYKFDVERPLDFIPFLGSNTLSVQAGFRHDEDENVKSGRGTGYRQILRPGAAYAPGDILDDDYVGQSPGFGLASQQWGSTYKLYEINRERDIFYVPDFDEETNTRVENYNSYVGQQKDLKESVDAWYGMLNGAFFNNRLSFVGGLRQETKRLVGRSPFTDSKWDYVRNADGTLYTDAANPNGLQTSAGNGSVVNGVLITPPTNRPLYANTPAGEALRQSLRSQGISFPDVPYGPPTGNGVRDLRARELQYQPLRAVNQKSKGDPSYSFSTVYRLTKKIDLKAAYSRSFKLPKLEA
ncbi:MAG TPA: carboxypeptidase regulatory-like domain-containing protein, partial [Opitutus sp.]|nr:carboxypeptidase regulatory-like domain-containing protein [Opitutus sp.]